MCIAFKERLRVGSGNVKTFLHELFAFCNLFYAFQVVVVCRYVVSMVASKDRSVFQ